MFVYAFSFQSKTLLLNKMLGLPLCRIRGAVNRKAKHVVDMLEDCSPYSLSGLLMPYDEPTDRVLCSDCRIWTSCCHPVTGSIYTRDMSVLWSMWSCCGCDRHHLIPSS